MSTAPPSVLGWLWRFTLAFGVLNTLLTFENRWPGFGVHVMPRLSFELCVGVALLLAWVAWRGALSARGATVATLGFVVLVAVRYADVTAPAVLGRPVNLFWDGRHGAELLRLAAQSSSTEQLTLGTIALVLGTLLLFFTTRAAIALLARCLRWKPPRPWLLTAVTALALSFAAYAPDRRDTRWFFSLPLTPTLWHQAHLLAGAWWPAHREAALGPGPAFDGDLSGLVGAQSPADVLLVFAESYGAVTFDHPDQATALAAARAALDNAIHLSGRTVVTGRVTAPTFGGASWLSHAALLAGVDTSQPADHDLLLASQRPTLVSHFARHGYRTVGWMPGLKRPWPEGAFYGFERLADDAGIGYRGPDFGYWRIPDQAAMALLHAQELGPPRSSAQPRFVFFPTTSTHAPFYPLAPIAPDWSRLSGPDAYTQAQVQSALAQPPSPQQTMARYIDSLRYQHAWMADFLQHHASPSLVMVVLGDHQPPALVSGPKASWDVPVHVISDNRALLQRLLGSGFVPGLVPPPHALGPLHALTPILLKAFEAPSAHESTGVEHVSTSSASPGS
ncbi:sulfatase-like hydrolase/transferase [Hydrogenophaga sp. BPS33]|uniref:sulfatase-like hydrolase/transferase n=1 Tax=Hydrogenophaga sp. BPS33 TaxID=2651974 RepID=UPI00131F8084|nr:sulfatase-like hydrolase/transferase [Hydrogenophaga sp. BPS33]QHE86183.1 sulfatase-like hydrolase/transferase [Hydrogenophaga sp. BPS33]